MSSKPDEAKAGLIEKTVEHAHAKLPAEQAARLEAFIRIYYGAVAAEDLLERSVVDLYGAALAHLNFGAKRAPGESKVRVYTPQLEEHGWSSPHTVVEIVHADMPFLVDSVSMELTRLGSGVHLIIHPVVRVRRDEEGRLVEVLRHDAEAADCALESFIHAEIVRETDPEHLATVKAGLENVLGDVRAAVEDWRPMVEKARQVIADLDANPPPVDEEELAEARALLEWIVDNHFTFLGYHEYDLIAENGEEALRRVPGTGLGILRDASGEPGRRQAPAGGTRARARQGPARPHEGELAGDGAPARLPRLRRREALRRDRARSSASGGSSASTRRPPTAPGRTRSRSSAARSAACASARGCRPAATTTRRWSRSSRPIRATSSSRSPTTTSSRSRWASSTSASGLASGSSRAATRSDGSSPASSSCRATASTRRCARPSARS